MLQFMTLASLHFRLLASLHFRLLLASSLHFRLLLAAFTSGCLLAFTSGCCLLAAFTFRLLAAFTSGCLLAALRLQVGEHRLQVPITCMIRRKPTAQCGNGKRLRNYRLGRSMARPGVAHSLALALNFGIGVHANWHLGLSDCASRRSQRSPWHWQRGRLQ